ncbi:MULTISPECIES: ribosomal protein S18-alanine N-acetyltransferase [Brevundimonas]|uniref:ribosomal protein S18-alanine N-acetyltransferase n=1 Tax=Brevundimonas TaxID=41275 RepID=UPI0019064F60|nr:MULTISPECIES: ribosomal protein S18-alanine N-acetyltransferase [Brevundimonas]MDA0743676.1 ribosomal protein S18-alanine N-acetyltransferase [Pseudomonadota bacterium]MBK1969275.1 ribosomal protein S18-alanine N-acetyltransferase [Brevundimonas diminuta]MBK1976042.1 ribosomal protein S18-alanine N-acetyltransferase [Brevundimonas diminuta]MDA1322645.1 ribosomal protein S18-alanine N-acetyltransferase [Pseudomonadota bacterium]MDM8352557.1 ribosomal protein S18-alanine N-acetyltransferase [
MSAPLFPAVDPTHLAAIHAEAFAVSWDEAALTELLAAPGVFAVAEEDGFILIRVVVDEAEILTLAVRPSARRAGLGVRLVEAAVVRAAALGAERMFLEVAEGNVAARALYARSGFVEMGRRRGYYSHADGRREDALTLVLNFPR